MKKKTVKAASRKKKAISVRPKMHRSCVTLTEELFKAIEKARKPPKPAAMKKFGQFVEAALRQHPDVIAAAKALGIEFKNRPTEGRPKRKEPESP